MRILIIEDEIEAAWSLQEMIKKVNPSAIIIGIVDSIKAAKNWLSQNEEPDLLFTDIQLGDGIVFEFLQSHNISCPIIFCTAFDEYLLQAFKMNGIDYVLKPISENEINNCFLKFNKLSNHVFNSNKKELLKQAVEHFLTLNSKYKTNFLISHRDKLLPIAVSTIAYFKIMDHGSSIILINSDSYTTNFTLEYFASVLDPKLFYRANRQFLISIDVIKEVTHYEDRKLQINLKVKTSDLIIVSKAKSTEFLDWLEKR